MRTGRSTPCVIPKPCPATSPSTRSTIASDAVELLFDGKSHFNKIHGDWFDAGAMDSRSRTWVSAPQETPCTRLREKTAGGRPATVCQISQVLDGKPRESPLWVSAKGFVLRMRDATGGLALRADYDGIKAPSGARRVGG